MQTISSLDLFFELVRMGIGTCEKLSSTPTPSQWKEIYEISMKQAVAGIAFTGVEKLCAEQAPPKELLLNWFRQCQTIAAYNNKLNILACKITDKFQSEGFNSVILKGQGIARLYDHPNRRMAGDIDIWLDGNKNDIIKYVKLFVPDCRPVYHHVDFLNMGGVETEIHFTPTWMNSYFTNNTLQKYFEKEKNAQFGNKISLGDCDGYINVPTNSFNRIYILLHIYRHLFQEGIGLRQILDYYYVLRQGFNENEKNETLAILKELKMLRFAGAVMYILKKIFNIEDKYMLTAPIEKDGEFLLTEVLEAGNFGKYSPRYKYNMSRSLFTRALSKSTHQMKFIFSYPSETIWGPLFRIWHYFHKKRLKSVGNEK